LISHLYANRCGDQFQYVSLSKSITNNCNFDFRSAMLARLLDLLSRRGRLSISSVYVRYHAWIKVLRPFVIHNTAWIAFTWQTLV